MNDSIRVMRRPRRASPPAARTAAAIIATAALALLAAACSGSPSSAGSGGSPHAAGSANSPSAVAYSHCMRSHGVPTYPDPGSNGEVPKTSAQQLGVSSSQYSAAERGCQQLLPTPTTGSLEDQAHQCAATGDCPPALVHRMLTAQLKFARCMRSHGFPKFPDPTTGSQGIPYFAWSIGETGMDPHSAQFEAKEAECQRLGGLEGAREVSR